MRLCLGTVQFGMDYGIANQKKPSIEDAIEMLDYATQNGIDNIDTANAYGSAEDVVGEFLRKKTINREKLFIISKFRPNLLDGVKEARYYQIMKENLTNSLSRLGVDYLDAYMLHSARYIYNDVIIDTLCKMRQEGLVRHVGVSVYEPEEAKRCIELTNLDFMQLPYSIFDQRMQKEGVFDKAKNSGMTIHSRSAFIQGLILMGDEQVPSFLKKARPIVREIDEQCKRYNVSRIALAMSFVKQEKEISHLVFGVDNLEQLKENIYIFENCIPTDIVEEIAKGFTNIDTDIVMPSLWKR